MRSAERSRATEVLGVPAGHHAAARSPARRATPTGKTFSQGTMSAYSQQWQRASAVHDTPFSNCS